MSNFYIFERANDKENIKKEKQRENIDSRSVSRDGSRIDWSRNAPDLRPTLVFLFFYYLFFWFLLLSFSVHLVSLFPSVFHLFLSLLFIELI